MFHVMFVCTGNTCRSPMAEGALRVLLQKQNINNITVSSSGTGAAANYPATAYAIEASKIWEADISDHKSSPLTLELIDRADLILAMTSTHCRAVREMAGYAKDKIFLLKNYPENGCSGEGVDDPIGCALDIYNQTFLEIGEELGRIFPHIIDAANKKNVIE